MKRKSKGLALLLALMMLISMNPAIVFAEAVQQPAETPAVTSETPVTPEDVQKTYEDLGAAVGSELDAAKEFFPAPETWDEVGAAVNDAAAGKELSDAEKIVENADEQTAEAAQDAETSKGKAERAASNAGGAQTTAERSRDYAQQQQAVAEDPESTKTEAEEAADYAGTGAAAAQQAATYAAKYAEEAAAEKDKAYAAYVDADKAYQAAKKEAAEKLAKGLINAREAAELTQAAYDKAEAAYNKWNDAKTAADTAAGEAIERANAANADLKEKLDDLDEAIASTSKDVASKTGAAAVTGSALAAAKVAAAASYLEVSYYEGKLKVKQAQVDDLNEKIADAQKKIEAADAVLQVKKAALISSTIDYNAKKAELEQAEKNLELARKAVKDVEAIIEQRDESGIRAQLDAVRSGDYFMDDVHDVAEYLMPADSEIKWESLESDVFSIGDQKYKVTVQDVVNPSTGVVTDRILKIDEYFPDKYEPIADLPDASKEWKGGDEPGVQDTEMKAVYNGESYEVFLMMEDDGTFRYVFGIGTNTYEILKDDNGFYFENKSGKEKRLTAVEAPKTVGYTDTEDLADAWDDATAKENALVTAKAARNGAVSAKGIAALVLGKSQIEYGVADVKEKIRETKKARYVRKHDKAAEDVLEIDSKLNTERWDPTDEQFYEILNAAIAVGAYGIGEPITLTGVKTVAKALLDFSIPAKERQSFINELLVPVTKEVHHDAVEELGTSVKNGSEAVSAAASAAAKAGGEAIAANTEVVVTGVTKAVVDKKFEEAKDRKDAADDAKRKAAIALEDYQRLADAYGPDDANVTKALSAYNAAQAAADAADEAAGKAKDAAIAANTAYEAAKAAAGRKTNSDSNQDSGRGTNDAVQGGGSTVTTAAQSGTGYAAAASTSKADTGDHSKTLTWLTVLCTAALSLTKGIFNRLKTQN